ncbi:hypothetical protein [Labilibaculum euxinus]
MKQLLIIVTFLFPTYLLGQDRPLMKDESGILKADINNYQDEILILNEDGSIWMKFDFNGESKVENKESYTSDDIRKLYNWKDEFNPYAFHYDYVILMFKCLSYDGERYKVIVDERTGLTKWIKSKSIWKLENWEEHIVNSVATIDADYESNPIRKKPDVLSTIIEINTENLDPAIGPLLIEGDWLKIKYWENDIKNTGWIRWKEGKQIIISLWYLM